MQWASNQIRKIAGCACAGNAGNVSPHRRLQRKLLVSDPGMHHGTCVTHVPWCMSGSLSCGGGENVPGIPGACAPAILCIWQEAHATALKICSQIVFYVYITIWVNRHFSRSPAENFIRLSNNKTPNLHVFKNMSWLYDKMFNQILKRCLDLGQH